jgi:hypothetical protein
MSYSDDSLRQLLELHRTPDGVLSTDQMRALVMWEQTPEDVRLELEQELRERGPTPERAPLTLREEEYLREKGLLENTAANSPSLLDRVRSLFRRK